MNAATPQSQSVNKPATPAPEFTVVETHALLRRIDWNLQCANVSPNHQFSLLMVSVDNLWVYQDCLGTHAADMLVRAVALTIARTLTADYPHNGVPRTSSDGSQVTIAHMGGEVLAVLLEGYSGGGAQAARQIRQALYRLSPTPDLDAFATATLGILDVRDGHQIHENAGQVLRDAQAAMNHARARGRGWACQFQPDLRISATSRLKLECDLRRAVNRGEFHLVYQPIVALDSGALTGFEALLRWRRQDGRFVSPAEFVPLAEETGLVWPIGEFVLREACRQLAAWRAAGHEIQMNVNVSRRQFAEDGLTELVSAIVRQHRIPPAALVLEITESSLLNDVSTVTAIMNRLSAAGIALHLDDFGTGYSSLGSLHQFPVKGLKIDRSFIASASGRRDYAAVLHAIVMLADNLGMAVVGEGIETSEQLALLQSLNCPLGQGYFFGKPMEPGDAERLLRRGLPLPN